MIWKRPKIKNKNKTNKQTKKQNKQMKRKGLFVNKCYCAFIKKESIGSHSIWKQKKEDIYSF